MKLALLGLLLIGCASTAPLNEPEIQIAQLSNVAEAARHISGPLPVQYQVHIGNRANVPITIKSIDVNSIGSGAYTLRPTSTPFNQSLQPGHAVALTFWAPAFIDDPTISGANGPVTIRVSVRYETPSGTMQSIAVQQVHGLAGLN